MHALAALLVAVMFATSACRPAKVGVFRALAAGQQARAPGMSN